MGHWRLRARIKYVLLSGHDPSDPLDWRTRLAIVTPGWWYTFATVELPCGCTRRKFTRRMVLFFYGCKEHT